MRGFAPIVAAALLFASSVGAVSSPSDIAAARKLAQEAIELYDARDYRGALERMQRAEALFDAPIHLLYIARAQQKLGQLVEASETYRKLVRFPIEADASRTFKDAVESGQRELTEVEVRIGALRIEVEPKAPNGLALQVDGKPVSVAVVGVDRPTNPGHHRVRAEAPGFDPIESAVELKEGEKRAVSLTLVPAGSAPASNTINLVAQPESKAAAGATASDKRVSFFIGLRLAAAIPAGTLYTVQDERVAATDYFGGGAFAELQGGVHFERYFAVKLYLEGLSLAAGSWLRGSAAADNSVSGQGIGLGGMVGTQPGQWGGFGELGFGYRRLEVKRDFEDGSTCGGRQRLGLNGFAFRLGGGAHIPVHRLVQLTPFVTASFGQVVNVNNDCDDYSDTEKFPASGSVASGDRRGHQLFLLGLGGDLLLGL